MRQTLAINVVNCGGSCLRSLCPSAVCLYTEGFLRQELRLGLDQWAPSAPRHFCGKFRYEIALARCPSACRLRRLAQKVRLTCRARHFSCNDFWDMSMCISIAEAPCAFRLRRLAQTACPDLVARHFSCKFSHTRTPVTDPCACRLRGLVQIKSSHRMALVTCPCAFRLRKLAQTVRPDLGARIFARPFSHRMALVRCPCAFRLHRLAQTACPDLGAQHSSHKCSYKVALVTCPCAFLDKLFESCNLLQLLLCAGHRLYRR